MPRTAWAKSSAGNRKTVQTMHSCLGLEEKYNVHVGHAVCTGDYGRDMPLCCRGKKQVEKKKADRHPGAQDNKPDTKALHAVSPLCRGCIILSVCNHGKIHI